MNGSGVGVCKVLGGVYWIPLVYTGGLMKFSSEKRKTETAVVEIPKDMLFNIVQPKFDDLRQPNCYSDPDVIMVPLFDSDDEFIGLRVLVENKKVV
jgi:hypothetical protein